MQKSPIVRVRQNLLTLTTLFVLGTLAYGENRLAKETSPHLLEHADSLVDWYPWGEEAFKRARDTKRPIFLSIGFHSCHWCHKMLNDSFNDPATAKILNDNFVSIKIDRAEYPEIDRTYMTYLQAAEGGGGWPLNVWLTADLVPFSVGSYFPKTSRDQPGFEKVLTHIVTQWRRSREYIDAQSKRDFAKLRSRILDLPPPDPKNAQSPEQHKLAAYERLSSDFDPFNGGFGDIPRFPSPAKIGFADYLLSGFDPESFRARQCRKMLYLSLDKMSAGGIRDQIGGGFYRYSSDPSWTVPHFEKMLNDQALMMSVYLKAYQRSGDAKYLEVFKSTSDFLEKNLKSPEGGYFSSTHSDSRPTKDAKEIVEGAYYVWGAEEFAEVTGGDAKILAHYFNIRPGGNIPLGGLAAPSLDSTNVLHQPHTLNEVAKHFGLTADETREIIERGKKALLAAREKRPTPAVDTQIITSWNALTASAYAEAFVATKDPVFLKHATTTLEFIQSHCYSPTKKELYRISSKEETKHGVAAEDFAFTIQACIDIYQAGFDQHWLEFASELQEIYDRQFYDARLGGYFNTARSRSDIIVRLKSYQDGSSISPNAISILNLMRLGALLGDEKMIKRAKKSVDCFRGALDQAPSVSYRLLLAESMLAKSQTQIVVVGKPGAAETDALIAAAHEAKSEGDIVVLLDPTSSKNFLTDSNPNLARFQQIGNQPTAFVCKDFSCKQPTNDPETVSSQLRSSARH